MGFWLLILALLVTGFSCQGAALFLMQRQISRGAAELAARDVLLRELHDYIAEMARRGRVQ